MSDLMCTFEDYLKTEKRSSANTVSSYLRDAAQFEAAMAQQGRRMEEVETEDIQEYVHSLIRQVRGHCDALRGLDPLLLPLSDGHRCM